MKNIELAKYTLKEIYKLGYNNICLCAGSRNSPFVELLDLEHPFKVYHFFEERDASFFAYQKTLNQEKTAVITTSGTAVSECLSAFIESYYKKCPLLIISADRPKTYRELASPQSILQIPIFKEYSSKQYDLDKDDTEISFQKTDGPWHINICFDEPLIDTKPESQLSDYKALTFNSNKDSFKENLTTLNNIEDALIYVTSTGIYKEHYLKELKKLTCPIYLESTSGLKYHKDLRHLEVQLRSQDILDLIKSQKIKNLIRIGDNPTHSFWRKIDALNTDLNVISIHSSGFKGVVACKEVFNIASFDKINNVNLDKIKKTSEAINDKKNVLIKKYPESEQAFIYHLSKKVKADTSIYLGNSLPIREWDLFQDDIAYSEIGANRGANGIDGQVASFLGFAKKDKLNIGIFGDLTFMYNLSAPYVLNQLDLKVHFVVINNLGGQIFSQIYKSKSYINSHNLHFSPIADMWGLKYLQIKTCGDIAFSNSSSLIEINPCNEQTKAFWLEWNE